MRRIFKAAFFGVVLLPIFWIGACKYKWWQFDHLEQSAKRAITAAELLTWATNVLNDLRSDSPSQVYQSQVWQLRTNYPAKLRPLCNGICPCWVAVHEEPITNSSSSTGYYPQYLLIIWSQKPSGDARFEIGRADFQPTSPNAHVWAPGVYFYRR